jgi:ubiquinone/menaquinone biosynthesis C-methylase UbiE
VASISFDRAASYYDETRGYPPGVDEQIADAIVAATDATPETRFIELGVGTGRIALPLIARGYDYTGVDLSPAMMARLRAKLADYQRARPQASPMRVDLREGDVTALPFADATFDVALTVHVLHLIPSWQQAISEAMRVVKPGGWYLNCGDDVVTPDEVRVKERWIEIMRTMGYELRPLGASNRGNREAFLKELQQRGFATDVLRTATWMASSTPQADIDYIALRRWSRTWSLSDEILAESVRVLTERVRTLVNGDLARPLHQQMQFVITRVRIP